MYDFFAKMTGWLMLLVGCVSLLAVAALLMFFVGLFGNIRSLLFMGTLNDVLNAAASVLSAILASVLYPTLRRFAPRLSLVVLISVWAGALAHMFGSWLILTDRSGVELSSYYYFVGNALIGVWLWVLNHVTRRAAIWPRNLTQLGLIAGGFMLVGLLGLYGIIFRADGDDFSPLVMVAGISFLGMGILYPIWCLRLGRWIVSQPVTMQATTHA
jgi:hypothetical protein